MMPETPRAIGGAVLAGGASRRMGTTKALVRVDGRPMAGRVAASLRAGGCATVIAVGRPDDLVALGADVDAVVSDRRPGRQGPLAGIEAALTFGYEHGWSAAAVLACDLPDVTGELVASLVAAADAQRVVVADSGRLEPLCAVWSVDLLDDVTAALDVGRPAVHELLVRLRPARVAVDGALLRNVNRPDDLDR